jgi:putative chitinase
LIQVTGYSNFAKASAMLDIPCDTNPELLAEPINAARSAADFWKSHGCNELADEGRFEEITRRINGGLNGYTDRCVAWDHAKQAMDVA